MMAKILLIDDDDAALYVLRGYAVCSGHEVDHSSSVQDALAKCKKTEYSLVFLDVHMPEYNGEDFLKIYLNMYEKRDTPIIIISADDSQETLKKMLNGGARGYLTKPVNKLEMLRLIEVYCQNP